MKLNKNEKFVLKLLLEDPTTGNSDIARQLDITSQAVGKIKKQLTAKGYIKGHEVNLDYEKMGISVHTIALIKVLPKAPKKFKSSELNKILRPVNAIRVYALPETDVTHVIIYAFRNITEYDNYFRKLLAEFGEFVEIKHAFVFSSGSIIKSSTKDLFLKIIEEQDAKKQLPAAQE